MAVRHLNNSDKQVQTIALCGGYVLDHIAIESSDIAGSVAWHQEFLSASVLHMGANEVARRNKDCASDTWAAPTSHWNQT